MQMYYSLTRLGLAALLGAVFCCACAPAPAVRFTPWPAAETLYTRVCDLPRTVASVGKTVRIRGEYWSDGGTHAGFFGASCPKDSRFIIDLIFPDDADRSVATYLAAVSDRCNDGRIICFMSYQLDLTGRVVVDEKNNYSLLVTKVNFFRDMD
jgi:hypothetical protein